MEHLPRVQWDRICPLTQWKPRVPFILCFEWEEHREHGRVQGSLECILPKTCQECGERVDFPIPREDMENITLQYCGRHTGEAPGSAEEPEAQINVHPQKGVAEGGL